MQEGISRLSSLSLFSNEGNLAFALGEIKTELVTCDIRISNFSIGGCNEVPVLGV